MALITTQTPNFIGGVSQQPAALRLPNQAEAQENAVGTVIEGLKKRPSARHKAVLTSAPASAEWHIIDRSAAERYAVAFSDDDLRVYDLATGTAKTIKDISGDVADAADFSYLNVVDPTNIEAITLADYTIVVNKEIQPKMSSAVVTQRNPEALIFVKAGNYGTKYVVKYTAGTETGTVTYETKNGSSATDIADVQTSHIAAAIHNGITAASIDAATYPGLSRSGDWPLPAASWSFDVEGSSIWVQRDDTTDFKIRTDDSVASTNLVVIKDSVQSFTELPVVAPNGFSIAVKGLPDQGAVGAASYYLDFETKSNTTTGAPGTAAFEDGVWEEGVKQGIEYKPDAATMPHLLIRMSDGTFLWTKADGVPTAGAQPALTPPKWGEIEAGDEVTNARPAWIAKSDGTGAGPIRHMSFFADRLVILAGQDITLSESGQYFNWFRTTVTSLLSSARLGVTAAHTSVNLLNYAVPMREQLVVFSQFTQFALRGSQDGTLTPTNVWVTAATEYETSTNVAPVASKRSIFATAPRGSATLVRELYDSGTTARPQFDAAEITSQVPTYLQGVPVKLAVSTIEDMVVGLLEPASGLKNTLYAFKYLVNGDRRVQSAWSKYTFGGTDCDIQHIDWVDQELYMIVKRGSQVCMETMNFEAYLKDVGSDFEILLDRRIDETDCTVTYSSALNQTTFTLPYTIDTAASTQVVTRAISGATDTYNLIVDPEDFVDPDSAWNFATGCTGVDNTDIAPNGTLTADTITSDGLDPQTDNISQDVTVAGGVGVSFTHSLYVKKKTDGLDEVNIIHYLLDSGVVEQFNYYVNLTTGAVTNFISVDTTGPSPYTADIITVTSEGDYWRIGGTITDFNGAPTKNRLRVYPKPQTAGTNKSIVVWGAQLVKNDQREPYGSTAGRDLPVVSTTTSTVVVSGNYATSPVYLGEQYQMLYQFSELGLRSAYKAGASDRPVPSSASFKARYGSILFEDSAYFKVRVTPRNQAAYEYPMTGQILGSSSTLVGRIGLESGIFRFPLMGDPADLTIEIINDSPLPSRAIAAEWESNYHTRNRRY